MEDMLREITVGYLHICCQQTHLSGFCNVEKTSYFVATSKASFLSLWLSVDSSDEEFVMGEVPDISIPLLEAYPVVFNIVYASALVCMQMVF